MSKPGAKEAALRDLRERRALPRHAQAMLDDGAPAGIIRVKAGDEGRSGAVPVSTITETGTPGAKADPAADAAKKAAAGEPGPPAFLAFKSPSLAVACPTCAARVGAWCKRPSGHKAIDLHADRRAEADRQWELHDLPTITQRPDGTFVYDGNETRPSVGGKQELNTGPSVEAKPQGGATQEESDVRKTKKAGGKAGRAKSRTAVRATETSSTRPDGLKAGTKLAKLLDAAVDAGAKGSTEAELCRKVGWVKCMATLRRLCDRVGAKLDRKDDGRYVVVLKKAA